MKTKFSSSRMKAIGWLVLAAIGFGIFILVQIAIIIAAIVMSIKENNLFTAAVGMAVVVLIAWLGINAAPAFITKIIQLSTEIATPDIPLIHDDLTIEVRNIEQKKNGPVADITLHAGKSSSELIGVRAGRLLEIEDYRITVIEISANQNEESSVRFLISRKNQP